MNGSVEGLSETLIANEGNYQNFLLKFHRISYHFQINVLYICDDTHINRLLTFVFQFMLFTYFRYLFC